MSLLSLPLLLFPVPAWSQNADPLPPERTIGVVIGYVQASRADQQKLFETSLEGALHRAGAESGRVSFARRSSSGTPRIDVVAMNTPENRMIALTFSGPGGENAVMLIRSPWDDLLPRTLTQALRFFEPALLGYPGMPEGALLLEDFFPLESIRAPSPGLGMMSLYPVDIALRPEGRVVVAGASFAVEIDRYFRITGYPGSDLLEQGIFNYAGAVDTTPAGTIYFRPSQGSDIYRVLDGVDRTHRLRAGVGGHGPFVVLPDGAVVTIDAISKRASTFSGQIRQDLPLFLYPDSYITAATAGPTGTIWALDTVEQRVVIFSPEGRPVDTIVPALPQMSAAQTVAMHVYPGGEFLMLTRAGLWKLQRDGRPIWHLAELPPVVGTTFMQVSGLTVDAERGLIYLLDGGNRLLIRLRDTAIEAPDQPESLATLQRINGDLNTRREAPDLLLAKARVYAETGATHLTEATYQHVLDVDPYNAEATAGLEHVRIIRLEAEARRLASIARSQLETMGPATAQASYTQALQSFERILALRPDSEEVRRAMEELREAFSPRDTAGDAVSTPLRIDRVTMENLFPGLFSAYRSRPVGEITLTNRGDEPITALRVSAEVRRYSDFPTETALDRPLDPGETVTMPVRIILNDAVFTVEEDLPLQARITVQGESGGREFTTAGSTGFTLYRRSALSWIETERLAGFITPHEGNVSRFAMAAANAATGVSPAGFSRSFVRAMQIADTLGLHGILYVEDPHTPISEILGRDDVIDTVRFPRTTLLNRAGDCDDTTTLLCSLYEAAGIRTAIVTTPDHVLMAFDTGDSPDNRWIYEEAGFSVFVREDRLWLPVETTVLGEGFGRALEAGTRFVRAAGGTDQAGFVTTEHAWRQYPTIPIPATELNVPLPPEEEIRRQVQQSGVELQRLLYHAAVGRIEASLQGRSGDAGLEGMIRLGALHLRFGETGAAERVLLEARSASPEAMLPPIHLATLYITDARPTEALEVLQPLYARAPRSLLVNALMARASLDLGQVTEGRKYAEAVESRSPELARRYGISLEGGASRASAEVDPRSFALPAREEDTR
ncbi:MAG: hypothetical protein EA427_04495 [Spirochaetaceae bacterium]|nr:MAG: hypothetical protein EA427_04495 [Spirochaetaceae bacterium]